MKAAQRPFVSVVIPTRNREKMLFECIGSLVEMDYPSSRYEIIIINDGINLSNSFVDEGVVGRPSVALKIVNISKRIGAGRARNVGVKMARGEIVAFVDDDAIVHKEWLKNLVKAYYFGKNIGGVGGRIVSFFDETPRNSHAPIGTIGWSRTFDNFNMPRRSKVDWIRGCNMSFFKRVFEEVGGFDESLGEFSHSEDIDISLRVKGASYDLIFEPSALVMHRRSPSEGIRGSQIQLAYWGIRNTSYVFLKNLPMPKRVVAVFRSFVIILVLCTRTAVLNADTNLSFLGKIFSNSVRGLIAGIMLARATKRLNRDRDTHLVQNL